MTKEPLARGLEDGAVLVLCLTDRVGDADVTDPGVLSEEERACASSFALEHLRKRFVCGRFMLRTLMGKLLSVQPRDVPLVKNRWGKPSIAEERIEVSLSYSGHLVAMAVSRESPLGVDVESLHRRLEPDLVSDVALRLEERRRLLGLSPEDRRRRFLGLWVQKEAVTKATGVGVRYPFSRLDARALAESLRAHLELLEIDEEFLACLVAPGSTREIRTFSWSGPGDCRHLGTGHRVGSGRPLRVTLS